MKIPHPMRRERLAFMASIPRSTSSTGPPASSTRCSTVSRPETTCGGCSSRTTNPHLGDIIRPGCAARGRRSRLRGAWLVVSSCSRSARATCARCPNPNRSTWGPSRAAAQRPRSAREAGAMKGIAAVGDVLAGKYRVDKILGIGGMGMVVAATHLEIDQRVAIKFMLPGAGESPETAARFLREAKAAGRLSSDHVCRVFDVGRFDSGAPYIVMEYLQGEG